MTGRQVIGVYMFLAVALLLLWALPRRSLYSRVLLMRWDVRRKGRYGQPRRGDYLRYALYSLLGGIALAAVTIGGIGPALEHVRPLSRLETWLTGILVGGVILGGMGVLASLVLVVRAAAWKPSAPLPFRIYRGDEVVGETRLEREALAEGIVSGGLRAFPSFADLAPAVRALSDAIAESADIDTTRHLIQAFARDQEMSVVDERGRAVDAHSVIVVDLQRLKLGRGLWTEVNLQDVNAWLDSLGAAR